MPGAAALIATLGLTALLLLVPSQSVLVVREIRTQREVLCARMADREEWGISYIHSVNRRPVHDVLRVEGRGLRILRSRFDAFGAGMPEVSTPENPLRTLPDGWLEYTVDRPVPDVTLFVGRVAKQTLRIRGRVIALASLAEPGTALHFSVEKRPLYRTGMGECL